MRRTRTVPTRLARTIALLLAVAVVTLPMFAPPVLADKKPAVPTYAPYGRKLSKKEEAWVRKTLASLTLDEKIGQMMTVSGNATYFSRDTEQYRNLERHITQYKVGGIIWFRSDVWATAILNNRLQEMSKVPLFVAADLEMGMGMRFNDSIWWPPNMAVGATGDESFARMQGEMTARQARAVGVNWLYAPDADVNNNPDNPVINVRSFGEDPEAVARLSSAFMEGVQNAGALACAKHFPGHGDTATDSHIGLPVVDVPKQRLETLELVPFRALVSKGIGSVMSAHISLPQVETELAAPVRKIGPNETVRADFASLTESNAPRVTLPATLSNTILTGILRRELGFTGLTVTDSMQMAGVSARYTPGEAAVRAIKAGIDVVLMSPDVPAAIAEVKKAVESGEISKGQIDASVERILRAKAALGLNDRRTVDVNQVDAVVNADGVIAAAQTIADRSVTLLRDKNDTLGKLRAAGNPPKVLVVAFNGDPVAGPDDFIGNLDEFGKTMTASRSVVATRTLIDMRSKPEDVKRVVAMVENNKYDAVILALSIRARSGKGSVAIPKTGKTLVEEIAGKTPSMVVVSCGNPYLLSEIPDIPCYLTVYSSQIPSQRAAARAVLGEIEIGGKLPVSLPGLYSRGEGITLKKK